MQEPAIPCVYAAGEQSGFYSSSEPAGVNGGTYRWPHPPPEGINSGVLVYDIDACACSSQDHAPLPSTGCQPFWSQWARALRATHETHPDWELQLGDQDVLNAAASKYPEMVGSLPCQTNLQDSGLGADAVLCLHSSNQYSDI